MITIETCPITNMNIAAQVIYKNVKNKHKVCHRTQEKNTLTLLVQLKFAQGLLNNHTYTF